MRARLLPPALFLILAVLAALPGGTLTAHGQGKKDYLSDSESDKIRDAETPSARVKLYLEFAADRLKKFQYELARATPERNRADILNGLLNAYTGCIDDAADLINLQIEKQGDIRPGLKELRAKGKEFLAELEKIKASGAGLENYKENLDDAIEGTQDALKDAEKAANLVAPPPVRRKP